MRKFLFIAFLFIASFASAQTSGNIGGVFYTGSKSATWWQYGKFSVLNIPKLIPSTGIDTASIYYKLSDSSLYIYTGSQWVKVGGSGGTLQQVTGAGNTSTNPIYFKDNFGDSTILVTGGNGDIAKVEIKSNQDVLPNINKMIYTHDYISHVNLSTSLSTDLRFPLNPSAQNNIALPNKSGTLPLSIRLNSTTYTANDTGSIELGTIGGSLNLQQVLNNGRIGDTVKVAQYMFYNEPNDEYSRLNAFDNSLRYYLAPSYNNRYRELSFPDNNADYGYQLPSKSGTLPLSIRLNSTTYTANDTGCCMNYPSQCIHQSSFHLS